MSVRTGFLPKTGSPTAPSTQRACNAAQEICFQKFQVKSEVFCWRGKIIHLEPCQEYICSEDETPDPSQVTSQGPSPTLQGHQKLFLCMFLTSLKTGEVYGLEHLWPHHKICEFWEAHPTARCPEDLCPSPCPTSWGTSTQHTQDTASSSNTSPLPKPSIPQTHSNDHTDPLCWFDFTFGAGLQRVKLHSFKKENKTKHFKPKKGGGEEG